jgi:hypothetical protein
VYGKAGSSKGMTNPFEVLDVEWDHRWAAGVVLLLCWCSSGVLLCVAVFTAVFTVGTQAETRLSGDMAA